jgi:hypothetical protein
MPEAELVLRSAYRAFNARDVEAAIELMHAEVDWPNAWEGGRVVGRAAVREYWDRQFAAISSKVEPEGFTEEADGAITVDVHQVVHDAHRRAHLRFASSPPLSARGWTGRSHGRTGTAAAAVEDPKRCRAGTDSQGSWRDALALRREGARGRLARLGKGAGSPAPGRALVRDPSPVRPSSSPGSHAGR